MYEEAEMRVSGATEHMLAEEMEHYAAKNRCGRCNPIGMSHR
jgi:hypothetical protein